MQYALKMTGETADHFTVGGYEVIWGGRDLDGEFFTKDTDFWDDHIESSLVMYQHGKDTDGPAKSRLGRVVARKADDVGRWVEAQIYKSNRYAEHVKRLIQEGRLGWSTGPVQHLVEIGPDGHIKSWPIAERSLTPNPAEPRTMDLKLVGKSIWDFDPERPPSMTVNLSDIPTDAAAPLAFEAEAQDVGQRATALMERTKDLHQRRLKEGRMLSGANREAIRACVDAMNGALEQLSALLAASEPPVKALGDDGVARELEMLNLYLTTV